MAKVEPDNIAGVYINRGVYFETVYLQLVIAVNAPQVIRPRDEELPFLPLHYPSAHLDIVWEYDFIYFK